MNLNLDFRDSIGRIQKIKPNFKKMDIKNHSIKVLLNRLKNVLLTYFIHIKLFLTKERNKRAFIT